MVSLSFDREEMRLRAKNFWRKNHRLIILIMGAAILGIIIAGVNIWNYDNTIKRFNLESTQTISNDQPASFTFRVDNPRLQSTTNIRLEVENLDQDSALAVTVNGQQVDTVTTSQSLISVSEAVLERRNRVEISKTSLTFSDQRLVSASVVSRTNMQQLMFVLLNFFSIVLIFSPVAYVKYNQYIRKQKMEEKFPEFLRDVVEGTRAGMSLPQSIKNTETGSYGPLDEKVDKMSAQLEWGIPFDQVLENFADETGSKLVKRSVDTIIQAYTSGGNIQDVLDSVGENIRAIKQLKEERQSQLYGEMITGYVVYFIFIGILIALTTYLLPNLAQASSSLGGGLNFFGGGGGSSLQQNISVYKEWFKRLVYIQAIFSGVIIGKLSEGQLRAGIKHSALLFAVGYLAVTFFF